MLAQRNWSRSHFAAYGPGTLTAESSVQCASRHFGGDIIQLIYSIFFLANLIVASSSYLP